MLDFSIDTSDFFYGEECPVKLSRSIEGGTHIKYESSFVFYLTPRRHSTPRRHKLSRLHKLILRDARRR